MSYNGYLIDWVPRIRILHQEGFKPAQIARRIIEEGAPTTHGWEPKGWEAWPEYSVVRVSGLVRHILGLNKKLPRREHRSRHGEWTPEQQFKELETELSG